MICMGTTFPAHDLKFHFDRQARKIHLICKRLYSYLFRSGAVRGTRTTPAHPARLLKRQGLALGRASIPAKPLVRDFAPQPLKDSLDHKMYDTSCEYLVIE